jgi:hypothetical protein
MNDAATPAVPNGGTPPAAPAAAPAPKATPEMVSLTKEAHDQLAKDAARAASNQRKADLYDRMSGGKGNHFKPAAPVTPPTPEESAAAGAAEDRKAERGLLSLAADPAFRDVLDADPTLRALLISNPLAVLPVLAPDAIDADDALGLVKEALTKRKPAAPAPATPPAPTAPVPPAGGVNPSGDKAVNEEVEVAKKNPNTERAVAGMIGAKLRGFKK